MGVGFVSSTSGASKRCSPRARLVRVLDGASQSDGGLQLYDPPHRHVAAALRAFVAMIRELGLTQRRRRSKRLFRHGARQVGAGFASVERAR
jgi:hypothetical protein